MIPSLISKQTLRFFLKPLGVHQGEEVQVLLLLGKGFFMGIFIATYYTGANTLFLNTFDESYLSKAFIASGILGVISTYLFSRFQTVMSFSNLIVLNLLLIAIIICSLRLGFVYTDSKWLIFLTFILNVPLSALTLLGFWGIVARIFNLRQAKRIIGSIDTGQLLAIIIAFYATPIITSFVPETINFFLISAVSIIISLMFLIAIVSKYDLGKINGKEEKRELKRKIKFKQLYKNNYVVLLSLFLIFSMVAFVFVDYSFLSVTKVKYPEEVDLANFLGVFNGTIMIMSFLMQTFVNDKLISMYGLKTCLMILPILLGTLTIITAFVGTLFGFSVETGTFLFFFLFIVLSKLVITSLRDALENPTIKLFFLPLDNDIRFDIQTKVEGVINQFSVLVAGGAIFLFSLLTFVELIHYSYFLLLIIAGWIYITGKIYFEYKNTLKKKLEEQKLTSKAIEKTDVNSTKLLERKLKSENTNRVVCSIKLLEKIEPVKVESSLIKLVESTSSNIREFAYHEVSTIRHPFALMIVSKQADREQSNEMKTIAHEAVKKLKEAEKINLSKFQFFILVKSSNYQDRKYAAKLLGRINDEEYNPFLIELMRDINTEVRIAALISAGKIKRPELWPLLIENLSSHVYEATAASSLVSIGKAVLPVLHAHFHKSSQKLDVMEKVVRLYGEIGGPLAIEYLWQVIDFPDKHIVTATLYALHKCNYQAGQFHAIRIKQYIEFDARNITWNLAALMEIPKGDVDKNRHLRNSLRAENKNNFNHIYMLLSMLYDEQSIQLVKENIESRTSEGVTFAIELLDVFLDDDIKPYLL
ncbi:MAG: MFS transporter, partial [Bacteroidota bacterium]|nr:MFS transporter [Bacteroidota bacterium]